MWFCSLLSQVKCSVGCRHIKVVCILCFVKFTVIISLTGMHTGPQNSRNIPKICEQKFTLPWDADEIP